MTNSKTLSDEPTRPVDARALSDIYLHYRGLIYFVIATYLSQKDDADDVYQEVFVRLLSLRGRPFTQRALKAYLCETAKSCALDWKKKQWNDLPGEVIETFGENDSPNPLLSGWGYGLSERESILMDSRLSFGLAWKDISEITGIPISTAKLSYHQALKKQKERRK
jgi:RNA polymerase sigma factor (sigma-70 family)